MEKQSYKRLGDYIEQVDIRNFEDIYGEDDVKGISTNKCFMPTKGNLIDVSFSNYKIVSSGQFAFNVNTARMGDRFAIALKEGDPCIVSSIYVVFRTKEGLLPEYLYLWCCRPEFDRYVRFMSHGSAREIFEWEDMCEVFLPIPDVKEQSRIVSEYQSFINRIDANNKLISSLEVTAKNIFDHYFSSAYFNTPSDELEELTVKDCVCINESNLSSKNLPPQLYYLETGGVTNNQFDELSVIDLRTEDLPSRAKRVVKSGDIVYSSVRPNLRHYGILRNVLPNTVVSTGFIVLNSNRPHVSNELIYMWITFDKYTEYLTGIADTSKATYPSIVPDDLLGLKIWVPKSNSAFYCKIQDSLSLIYKHIGTIDRENQILTRLTAVLLPKLMS